MLLLSPWLCDLHVTQGKERSPRNGESGTASASNVGEITQGVNRLRTDPDCCKCEAMNLMHSGALLAVKRAPVSIISRAAS